jgi:hypothetical protein
VVLIFKVHRTAQVGRPVDLPLRDETRGGQGWADALKFEKLFKITMETIQF